MSLVYCIRRRQKGKHLTFSEREELGEMDSKPKYDSSSRTKIKLTGEIINEHLQKKLSKLNSKKRNWLENQSPINISNQKLAYLLPLKPSYDASRRIEARVIKYSVINIDQNKYSVPDYLVGKFIMVKIYPDNIERYYKENKVAEHNRSYLAHH